MVNSKTHGMRGAVALIIALLMVAFGMLCSMPANAKEGGDGQTQISQGTNTLHSEDKENVQDEGLPVEQDGEDVKGDAKDEHADSLDGDNENANAPPSGIVDVIAGFLRSLGLGGMLQAESTSNELGVYISIYNSDYPMNQPDGTITFTLKKDATGETVATKVISCDSEQIIKKDVEDYNAWTINSVFDEPITDEGRMTLYYEFSDTRWSGGDYEGFYYSPSMGSTLGISTEYLELPHFTITRTDEEEVDEVSWIKVHTFGYIGDLDLTTMLATVTGGGEDPATYQATPDEYNGMIYAFPLKNGQSATMSVLWHDGANIEVTSGPRLDMTSGTVEEVANNYWRYLYPQAIRGADINLTVKAHVDPQPETVNIPVQKVWNDQDNLYENRPDSVTYHLYASVLNGEGNSESEPTLVDTKVGYATNDYAVTFEDKPKVDGNGNTLTYHVGEEPVLGYKDNDGYLYLDTINAYTPRNVFDGENAVAMNNIADMKQIYVLKSWNDEGHEDARPESVSFNLMVEGEAVDTVELSADDVSPLIPDDERDLWLGYFSIDYPVAYEGEEIDYSIVELDAGGYSQNIVKDTAGSIFAASDYMGFTVTNTYVAPAPQFWDAAVYVHFEGDDGHEDMRPSSVHVNIYGNDGEKVAETEADSTVTHGSQMFELSGLVQVPTDNNYTVDVTPIDYYDGFSYVKNRQMDIDVKGPNVLITLRHNESPTVDIPVTKRWNTEDDPYNNRPESITYKLYAISAPNIVEMNHYVSTLFCSTEPTLVMTQAASAADNYATTFSGMPATDEAGNDLTYIVGEEPVPGFYTVDGAYKNDEGIYEIDTWRVFDGTNPVTIWNSAYELRTFKITKIWDDKGHEDERPESVTINLLADGEVVDSLTLSEANIYTTTHDDVPGFNPDPAYAWSNYLRDEDGKDKRLPSYRNGREIEYTLEEEAVDGYESVMGDAMPYFGPKGALPLSLSITNAYTGASSEASDMRRTIKVHKTWDDAGYEDERPESVTIRIYADGKEVDTAELNEDNGWSHVFAGVLEHEDGGLVEYQVTEDPVDGYETSVEIGTEIETSYPHYVFTITNTRIKEPVVEAPKPKDEEPAKPKDEEQPVIKKIVELVPTGGVSVLAVVACVALVSAIGVFVTRSKAGR